MQSIWLVLLVTMTSFPMYIQFAYYVYKTAGLSNYFVSYSSNLCMLVFIFIRCVYVCVCHVTRSGNLQHTRHAHIHPHTATQIHTHTHTPVHKNSAGYVAIYTFIYYYNYMHMPSPLYLQFPSLMHGLIVLSLEIFTIPLYKIIMRRLGATSMLDKVRAKAKLFGMDLVRTKSFKKLLGVDLVVRMKRFRCPPSKI